MSKRADLYTGRAGHLAVMAELLLRGWNAAIPEVDVGDDIFVVRDSDGNLRRVQVKTAIGKSTRNGHSAQFNLPLAQLRNPITPDLIYVFAVRLADRWDGFVVIDRKSLHEYHQLHGVGSKSGQRMVLRLRFRGTEVNCGSCDFSKFRNNWHWFPAIRH